MNVTDPAKLNEYYNDLFKNGDLEGLLDLYEADAVLCSAPEKFLRGHAQICDQLKYLLSMHGELTANQLSCVQKNDLALITASWNFKGKDSEGKAIVIGGHSSKLARRNGNGVWRYVIDQPVAFV